METVEEVDPAEKLKQFVLWKKVKTKDGNNFFFNSIDNNKFVLQELTLLQTQLDATKEELKKVEQSQLKIAVEAYSGYLRSNKFFNSSSSFTQCKNFFENYSFWQVISPKNRLKIFNQYLNILKKNPKVAEPSEYEQLLKDKMQKMELELMVFRSQMKVNMECIKEKHARNLAQYKELEELSEQLLEKDQQIKDITSKKDLKIAELQDHIRYLQENQLTFSDIIEEDAGIEENVEQFDGGMKITAVRSLKHEFKKEVMDDEPAKELLELPSEPLIKQKIEKPKKQKKTPTSRDPQLVIQRYMNDTYVITRKNKWCCPKCPYFSKTYRYRVVRHFRDVHLKEKPFQCTECLTFFSRKTSLQDHQEKLHCKKPTKEITCDICSSSFLTYVLLSAHMENEHEIVPSIPEPLVDSLPPVENPVVGKKASRITSVFRGYMKNENSNQLTCTFCKNKRFRLLASFKNHMRIHQDKLPDKCTHCGEGFLTKTHLNDHQVNKHFVKMCCPVGECTFKNGNKAFYRRHLNTKHKSDPFVSKLMEELEKLKPNFDKLAYL